MSLERFPKRRTRANPIPIPAEFYDRDPRQVARDLLGRLVIRETPEGRTAGRIVETEAYLHAVDPACHAYKKKTPRNASMFGPPGRAYIYAIHAKWCFNVVTQPEGIGSAVLIRAIEPLEGIELMEKRRKSLTQRDLTRGPARLCQAMDIDRSLDGIDLTQMGPLMIAEIAADTTPTEHIAASTRIGVTSGTELPYRYFLRDCLYVSAHRRAIDPLI